LSLSRDEVGGICPGIVVDRVGKVIRKVLQWTLSGDNSLNKESEHGEHGKPAILDFLDLELSKGFWVISKAQWVEATTGVEWVSDLTQWPTSNAVALNSPHQDNLASPDGKNALRMDQAWVAEVVKATRAEDLGSGLEPHGLTKLDTVACQELRKDASESSKHGPSAMDHLELTVLGKGLWVSGQPSSVPPVVAWEFTSELGGSPDNGPKYLTRSGPYHGLPGETGLGPVFLMETLPVPRTSGASFTTFPANDGEERAIVEAA
ncbi:LOW QUALITY PROTEIN: hypothetical protein RJ641_017965, partial [Dillenia turbinata]